MVSNRNAVFEWLDSLFKENIPVEVKALYINLVASVSDVDVDLELFGIKIFDPTDEDWACDFSYQGASLELLDVMATPSDWEKVLHEISSLISDYFTQHKVKAKQFSRIGIGFSDSDIVLVKNEI